MVKRLRILGKAYYYCHWCKIKELPTIPQNGKNIIGYQAMTLEKQPKKLIIVGSGAIGIEFAYFYNAMGTEVVIVEYMIEFCS